MRRAAALVALAGLAACSGGGDAAPAAPSLAYPAGVVAARVGEPLPPVLPLAGSAVPADLSVAPPLPAGLALDPDSGALAGTPQGELAATAFLVSGTADGVAVSAELTLLVGPALPPEVQELSPGYAVEALAAGVQVPVRMALAPDGRLFFNELGTGNVQVIAADGSWMPAPFASVAVQTGDQQGLLGLALAPDFALAGHVYVYAVVPADAGGPVRGRVLRFRDELGVGVDETVIVDDLPAASIDNGGELAFDAAGRLLVTVGDVQDPPLAQDPAALAGKLLRYTADGALPADNPDPSSPVVCTGLRNTFALAVHPTTGDVYGADNGPTEDDELNFLVPGKNFGWGYDGEGLGAEEGYAIRTWRDVIAPTALVFHPGGGAWGAHAGELFIASYAFDDVRRVVLLGAPQTDFHMELPFLRFHPAGVASKPLDLELGPDGTLYVSTFSAIWRVRRL